ncbi:DUF2971 domain-containing protein [Bosea sp. (in: a-proteobacteria)]|uniref:DUF2971 domain-containing protein n=1 Tax=Bosea sp. (in: a-proteobacteria) TaxID=1871050 RepID=UPI003B3A7B0F
MAVDSPTVSPFYDRLAPLWDDISDQDEYWNKKPLLAHYTSLGNLESILRTRELWFANPTLMNDREELEFGLQQGMNAIVSNTELRECFSPADYTRFIGSVEYKFGLFIEEQFPDTYIFCTSEIDKTETDGRLAMWRAYGFDGNGVAIVFDTAKIKNGGRDAPLTIVKVEYRTNQDRVEWLR